MQLFILFVEAAVYKHYSILTGGKSQHIETQPQSWFLLSRFVLDSQRQDKFANYFSRTGKLRIRTERTNLQFFLVPV